MFSVTTAGTKGNKDKRTTFGEMAMAATLARLEEKTSKYIIIFFQVCYITLYYQGFY
jgi:hypothetical protein